MDANTIFNVLVFAIFSILWFAFLAALIFNRQILDTVWQSFRGLPLLVKLVVILLALPFVLGLWIWKSSWPLWLRLTLVIGLAWWNVFTFFPRPFA